MIRAQTLVLAATIAAGVAGISGPAMADYVRLGSVDVGYRTDSSTAWSKFGGHMEGLRLVADHSDIFCPSIKVEYDNGQWRNLYSGGMQENRPINVDLVGGNRSVRRINFVCRSSEYRGGKINILADVGRYRDEWRRSPDWNQRWSGIFHWDVPAGPGASQSYPSTGWVSLGRQNFRGRNDKTEFDSRGIGGGDRIGLRALDGDARCTYVRVFFGNGTSRSLNASGLSNMQRGRVYQIDMPGNARKFGRIDLSCGGLNSPSVAIEILARK